jgi:hypothetical protein
MHCIYHFLRFRHNELSPVPVPLQISFCKYYHPCLPDPLKHFQLALLFLKADRIEAAVLRSRDFVFSRKVKEGIFWIEQW